MQILNAFAWPIHDSNTKLAHSLSPDLAVCMSANGACVACTSCILALLPGVTQGIEIGVALVNDFGKVVCQVGADNLRPILKQLLDLFNKQSPATLGQLPALTAALTKADPKLFSVRQGEHAAATSAATMEACSWLRAAEMHCPGTCAGAHPRPAWR